MRKISIITSVCFFNVAFGQAELSLPQQDDPFRSVINRLFGEDAIRYQAEFHMKNLFESDTSTATGSVTVIKDDNRVSYLNILDSDKAQELLFYRDTSWLVNHADQAMEFLGRGLKPLEVNPLSSFFPFNFYLLDTTFYKQGEFWETVTSRNEFVTIAVNLVSFPENFSEVSFHVLLDTVNDLLAGSTEYAVVMNSDFIFQQRIYEGYSFPDPDEISIPGYFYEYSKMNATADSGHSADMSVYPDDMPVYLENPELYNLEGERFFLPEDGLIFIDLWYAGCLPCIKAIPVVEEIRADFSEQVYFFSVNETDSDTVKINKFIRQAGFSMPVLLGGKEKIVVKTTGANAYPAFILMDATTGKVLWKFSGYHENLGQLIRDAILKYL